MIVHRGSTTPPLRNGKRQTLCGNYLRPVRVGDDPSEVTCKVCIRATTSQRTIQEGRVS
jgi:hypothetical protein